VSQVLVTHDQPDALAGEVESILGERFPWVGVDHPKAMASDVWFCAHRPPATSLALPVLRWIHSGWAGVENWLSRPEWRDGVILTRTVGDFPERIAEYVFGYLLARELGVPEALNQMKEHAWRRWTPGTLSGRALLVVGYGAIGRRIGAVGRALGMSVDGIRRRPLATAEAPEGMHGLAQLDSCLARADIVVNVLPLTSATESFWNRERFARLRDCVTFVSVSRGATVDEAALLTGLSQGRPARAILDVFREEPLPATDPLRSAEAIWITPHVSGIGTLRPLAADFAENWRRFGDAVPLRHVVDRARGY
jgi:phosphoglycerate dehydrogenase-like enzyme